MRKIFQFLLAAIFFALLFTGCSGSDKYKAETATVDSLMASLDSAEKMFLSLDSATHHDKLKSVNALLSTASEVIMDTLQREEARLLSDFRSIKKPLKEFITRRPGILNEINVTRKQLTDLKHDLEEGLISEEDAKAHFPQERELAKMLINSIRVTYSAVTTQSQLYDSLNPLVVKFVEGKREVSEKSK